MKKTILAAVAGLIVGAVGTAGVGSLDAGAGVMTIDNVKIFRTDDVGGWGFEVCGALYKNKNAADGGTPLKSGCRSGRATKPELVQGWLTEGEEFWRSK